MREWWSRLYAWTTGRRGLADDLAEEMQAHVEMQTEGYIERGMSPGEASKAARAHFGNATSIAERVHDSWGFPSLESVLQDVRLGFRAIRRSPGFSAIVILTLALGIGLNTAIFSLVHSVLLKPLPYPDAERLVWFGEQIGRSGGVSVTWVNFKHWHDTNRTFDVIAARQFTNLTMTSRAEPQQTR